MSKVAVPAEREQAREPRGRAKDSEAKRRRVRTWAPRAPELGEVLASPGHPLDPGLRREMESPARARLHAGAHPHRPGRGRAGRAARRGRGHRGPGRVLRRRHVPAVVGRRPAAARPRAAAHDAGAARVRARCGQAGTRAPSACRTNRSSGRQRTRRVAARGHADSRPADQDRDVRERAPTAAWLRYATVTAEQRRTEQLDPATLVDRLAAGILRSLRGDPGDWSKRVRLHLVRLGPELRSAVLDKLEVRLPSAPYQHVRHCRRRARTRRRAAPGGFSARARAGGRARCQGRAGRP